jgi:hypothetical protein
MSRLRSRVVPAAASTSLRRLIIGCSAAALLLAGGLAVSTAVQATTPPAEVPATVHPFVGSWIYHVDGFPEEFTALMAIHADGTLIETNANLETRIGSWEATGPDSFNLTFNWVYLTEDEGSLAGWTIRASGEVSEDGQGWTAEYTLELTGEGAPPGEFGPGSVTARRINVELMGTPVAPVESLFPDLFPPEEGTAPAGTEPVGTTPSDAAVATTTG